MLPAAVNKSGIMWLGVHNSVGLQPHLRAPASPSRVHFVRLSITFLPASISALPVWPAANAFECRTAPRKKNDAITSKRQTMLCGARVYHRQLAWAPTSWRLGKAQTNPITQRLQTTLTATTHSGLRVLIKSHIFRYSNASIHFIF